VKAVSRLSSWLSPQLTPQNQTTPKKRPHRCSYAIADGTRYGYRQSAHDRHGTPIGPRAQSPWLRVVPWGLYKTLKYAAARYNGTELFVTENGVSVPGEAGMSHEARVADGFRVGYFAAYLDELCRAVDEGALFVGLGLGVVGGWVRKVC